MRFSYVAVDTKGKEAHGWVDADGQQEAIVKVRGLGLFPVNVFKDSPSLGQEDGQGEAVNGHPDGDAQAGTMDAAVGMMAASCGAMLQALMKNGFSRSEAVELVKVFLAQAIESGIGQVGREPA